MLTLDSDPDEYVDVTEEFIDSLKKVKSGKVVQSKLFNLLEGTRAVEISNPKLDTGLISLNEAEINFDPREPQSIEEIIGICNKLLKLLISWLNSSSLPVTVLSCRYVQTILDNYRSSPGSLGTLKACTFELKRLKAREYDEGSLEYKLINTFLRSFVLGLSKFIGFCLNMAYNVLYEEEDLTTRAMELNFLSEVPLNVLLNDINETISWIKDSIDMKYQPIFLGYLELAESMAKIESVLNISVLLFGVNSLIDNQTEFLTRAVGYIEEVKKVEEYPVPDGSFSQFVQMDMSNKNIPTDLYEVSQAETFTNLTCMFTSIYDFIQKFAKIENMVQLASFLRFEVGYKIHSNYNVISRGIFQLFLIRDDKSIVGSHDNIGSLTLKSIENLVGKNSSIFNHHQWNIQGTAQFALTTKNEIFNKLNLIFGDLESGIYHYLNVVGNNRCRQRQLMSKSLLIWDTLQVNFESFEIELWERFKIGDILVNEDAALSLSSFIYYMKLDAMIETALLGFELELYKEFEFCLIFWYVSYLSQIMIEHLTMRINGILEQKINFIEITVPKRIKKLKAGPKKNSLKETNKNLSEQVLPSLQKTLNYNKGYLVKQYIALQSLSEGLKMFIIVLSSLNIIGLFAPKKSITSPELLFELRMKPWSSIGVPVLPNFAQYKQSVSLGLLDEQEKRIGLRKLLHVAIGKFNQSKLTYANILQFINENDDQFMGAAIVEWYSNLSKTCVMYSLEATSLIKILEGDNIEVENFKIEIDKGYHVDFPKLSIIALHSCT
ncbi:uncharacterized protein PRCAT00005423001 [Priceomyces carsonii]|uniref:uncharacterized protein n=1 Tax=Priceomyces carsonii TaxID=28549 RepID=UPI002ED98ABC|nr:unnamed protein product [Priceomyces carsonii]